MVKCKLFRNYVGEVSVILIDNVRCSTYSLIELIDIFNPKFLLTKIVALDRNDVFLKSVSGNQYKIFLPEKDTITSEVIITSKVNDIILAFETLVKSEPRCVSLYEIDMIRDSNIEVFDCDDEFLIKSGIVDYSISLIIEECCIKITFNSNIYNPKHLFALIKERFLGVNRDGSR